MATKITKDGRTIKTGKDMTALRMEVAKRDNFECQHCGDHTPWNFGVLNHKVNRRMGGGSRLDTPENLEWICRQCD